MTIVHKLEGFLFALFPKAKQAGNDLGVLKEELSNYYTFGPHKPSVSIEDGLVRIDIDTPKILKEDSDYRRVISLCENNLIERVINNHGYLPTAYIMPAMILKGQLS